MIQSDKKFIIGIQMDLKQFTTMQEALSMKIMTIENWAKHGQLQGFELKINGNDKWTAVFRAGVSIIMLLHPLVLPFL